MAQNSFKDVNNIINTVEVDQVNNSMKTIYSQIFQQPPELSMQSDASAATPSVQNVPAFVAPAFSGLHPNIGGVTVRPYENKANTDASGEIFVFDFDHTLTSHHTNGHPKNGTDYFTPAQRADVLAVLKDLRARNVRVIILSRGIEHMIASYLMIDHRELYDLTESVIGALNKDEVTVFGNPEATDLWAEIKANYLVQIQNRNPNATIRFFDDTPINILVARKAGFISYQVILNKQNHSTNIKQIIDQIFSRPNEQSQNSAMKKYLKYKQKYLQLKQQLNK